MADNSTYVSTYASDPATQLRVAVSDVFQVDDMTLGDGTEAAVRFRGRFFADPEQVYPQVRERFRNLGYTPLFRHQDGRDVILAAPGVVRVRPSRNWINVALFIATVASVWFVGGLAYAASLLGILLVHELGHYFMARRYGVAVTLPYFIPFPLPPLGTMGAAILMKEPMPNRKVVFDIGIAGPLAGLVVAVPLLFYGLSLSQVQPLPRVLTPGIPLTMEGNSLFYLGVKYLMFGRLLPSVCSPSSGILDCLRRLMLGSSLSGNVVDVMLHPIAFAGWTGLLVTMLNLLPASQLDGGHVIYTLLGDRSRYLSMGLSALLLLLSLVLYRTVGSAGLNWVLWAGLIYLFGWQHPPTLNELVPLDTSRRLLAIIMLILFVLLFVPVPLRFIGG